jgi:hypothetical protein
LKDEGRSVDSLRYVEDLKDEGRSVDSLRYVEDLKDEGALEQAKKKEKEEKCGLE